jgi:hypothetical protein
MRRIRILTLGLLALMAITAYASASASAALPELVNNKGEALKEKEFTSKSGKGTLKATNGTVMCTADTNKGTVTGTKSDEVVVTFTNCTDNFGNNCQSAGQATGTIVTNLLESTLGYINKTTTPPEVGIDLAPKAPATVFVSFKCGPFITVEVRGSVIGKITPVNKLVKTTEHFTLAFTEAGGKQVPEKFEGGAKDTLESNFGFGFEPATLTNSDELFFKEEAKINA